MLKKKQQIMVELECELGKMGVKVFSGSYMVKEEGTDNSQLQIFVRRHINPSRIITKGIEKEPTTFKLVQWKNRIRKLNSKKGKKGKKNQKRKNRMNNA